MATLLYPSIDAKHPQYSISMVLIQYLPFNFLPILLDETAVSCMHITTSSDMRLHDKALRELAYNNKHLKDVNLMDIFY